LHGLQGIEEQLYGTIILIDEVNQGDGWGCRVSGVRKGWNYCLLPIAYCLLPVPCSLFPVPCSPPFWRSIACEITGGSIVDRARLVASFVNER
jgi:hypothetical protein